MFSFSDMFHFLAYELACLGRRRFAFALVFTGSFYGFFFWHTKICFAASQAFGRHKPGNSKSVFIQAVHSTRL
jgi:hypothetical protein